MQARRTFQVKRTGPNGKDFPLPLSCVYQFLRIFIGNGEEEGWGVCPVRGPPRRVNPASGLSTRSFLPCVSKRKRRRRGKSKGKKETKGGEGGRGPPFNASRQNSLNARESSCRCRFSPFSPLPPSPSSFPVFLPSRCLSPLPPCQPGGPVTLPPHFRASRIHAPHFRRHCPVHAFPIIQRQRKTKRRRNINTRQAGNEPPRPPGGGQLSNFR